MPLTTGGGHRHVMDNIGKQSSTKQSNNIVYLTGRVSAPPETRILPSGDEVVSFRLIVPRSAAALRRSKQLVDTFECTAWTVALRRSVGRLDADVHVEIVGELRRRFSRQGGMPVSFVTVEVASCRRVVTPAVASQA